MNNNFSLKKNKYGFFQINPTPSSEEITKFYANEFYTGEYKNFNDSSLEVQLNDKEFLFGKWQDIYDTFIEINPNLKKKCEILDIGCGWAQALLFFKDKGFDCYGFDPAPEAVEYGKKRGLNLKHAGLDGMDVFSGKQFDVVCLLNVLEHVADPEKTINQIRKILKKDGILLIDVPNEFNDFQVVGRDLHSLDDWWIAPPNHLNYFNKASLETFLKELKFDVRICESSFPLEIFLLFGDNYVKNEKLGSACHKKRVAFEENLRKFGKKNTLKSFYRSLANLNLGRQISVYCTK